MRREAHAHHDPVVGLHPGDDLSPRLGPGWVEQDVAAVDQLADRGVDVIHLELVRARAISSSKRAKTSATGAESRSSKSPSGEASL